MTTLSNYSALRNYAYTSGNETVFVEGYANIGDGGDGFFYWAGTGTGLADNNGTILLSSSGVTPSGAWIRMDSDIVNVKWFGATGGVKMTGGASTATSGSDIAVTAPHNFFTTADIGNMITIYSNGGTLPIVTTRITGYTSLHTVTVPSGIDPNISNSIITVYGLMATYDGAMTSGSTTLNSATALFASTDVGKIITVTGVTGVSGGPLTITAYTSATQVTLSNAAPGTISAATVVVYRSDDTPAIQNAINYANTNHIDKNVFIPSGNYLVSRIIMPYGMTVFGSNGSTDYPGGSGTCMWQMPMPASNSSLITVSGNPSPTTSTTVRNFWFGTIRDLALVGYTANSQGFGISLRSDVSGAIPPSTAPTALMDTSILTNLSISHFPQGGIELPDGGDPGYLQNIKFNRNGGPGITISQSTTSGGQKSSVQSMSFINISGDGNKGGLIYINGYNSAAITDTFVFVNLKGEGDADNPFSFYNGVTATYDHTTKILTSTSSFFPTTAKGSLVRLKSATGTLLVTTIDTYLTPTTVTLTAGSTDIASPANLEMTTIEQQNFIVIDGGCTAMISIHGACNQPGIVDTYGSIYALGDLIKINGTSNPVLFWNGLNIKYVSSQILVPGSSVPNLFSNPVTGAIASYNQSMGGSNIVIRDTITSATTSSFSVANALQLVKLAVLTAASSVVTLPAASNYTGFRLTVWNQNTSGTYHWSFASAILDATGGSITTLANQTIYQLESDGTNWIKLN